MQNLSMIFADRVQEKKGRVRKMKYVYQIGIISGISFAAELLYALLPFPVPASVYGLVILLLLLLTKTVKLEQVETVADWLIKIMPILFVGPSVGLINSFDDIKGQILPLVLMCVCSTLGVMIVTSIAAQAVIRRKRKIQIVQDKDSQTVKGQETERIGKQHE